MCRMAYFEKLADSYTNKKKDFRTYGICLHICGFYGHIAVPIYSSSLLFRLPPMQPLAGNSESPASSPSALQPVVTEQGRQLYKNMARKVTRHGKFKLSLGFGQKYKYPYEGIWGTDKSRHLDWSRHASLYRGKMVL